MLDSYTLDLVNWLEALPLISVYLAFVLIAYLENVLPPVPGDILVVFAGYLAADGFLNFTAILTLTTVSSVLGFMTMYYIGYKWGDGIREKRSKYWMFKYIDFKYMTRAQGWMNRWGQGVILANRFLAGTRSVISLLAGITHMHVQRTILSSTVSSLLWNVILLGSGWFIKENWEKIGMYLSIYSWVILAFLAIFIGYRIWKYRGKRQAAKKLRDRTE
ncbi:MAG: DedA family protein [Bacteroidetes bacterium]|nr:DedA family protein [Bacteroidota bacterium]MCH8525084.1 DedA family protein [Balneolales bacterium]